jgi:hypothetical protein
MSPGKREFVVEKDVPIVESRQFSGGDGKDLEF